jgi:phage major head subunit gpT-like protein
MFLNGVQAIAASKNFTGAFYTELENNPAPPWIALVFRIILSAVRTEIIAFTKGFPQMREWLGDRRIQSLSEYSVTVSKKDFELTVGVSRDDIFFDKFDNIATQIKGIAQAVPRHFVKFFTDMLLNGFSTVCYDGANYFSTTHPNGVDSTGAALTYSNTTANALTAAEYQTGKTAAAKIKNPDSNVPLSIRFNWLFYGPNAEPAVLALFGTQRLAGGADNVFYNQIPESQRILLAELGDTAKWFLFDLTKILKPFILQIVKGVDFVPFDSPNDWIVFSKREYVYGIDTMDNAAYLLPELAYGSSTA